MTTADNQQLKMLLDEALALPPEQRGAFLDESCGSDAALRAELLELLDAHQGEPDFLESPALAVDLDDVARWADPDKLLLGERINGWKLDRVIASGGMGTVFQASEVDGQRTVAIKLMRSGVASESAMRRFRFEAEALSRLDHEGVARVYEAGTHDDGTGGVPFFVMEYVANARPITEDVQARQLNRRDRLELFARVCDAVHHGHQKGIIHRDLKPSNVLVAVEGDDRDAEDHRLRRGSLDRFGPQHRHQRDQCRTTPGHAAVHEPRAMRHESRGGGCAQRHLLTRRGAVRAGLRCRAV